MTSNTEINTLIDQILITLKRPEDELPDRIIFFVCETVSFIGTLYNEKDSLQKPQMENFISRLATETFNNNKRKELTIECLRNLLDIIFPKIAAQWDDPSKANLFGILKRVQEFVLNSDDCIENMRLKFLMTDLLKNLRLRFNLNAEIKDGSTPEDVFTVEDLRNLNIQLAKDTVPKQ